jgi:hypothetical protein
MTPYSASKGMPAPRMAILGTGLLLALWRLEHPARCEAEMGFAMQFQKNLALLGASLMLLIPELWAPSLGR